MRITIIGGGPAGLYFAILMKKLDPGHEITVLERNPPDATFGWGVVFSEETLGSLRDADYDSYIAITDTFASWDAIEIHHRDRVMRSRGHAFSAISRRALLGLLQRRARELGVELRFEVEVETLSEFADADLIVGADGVNSRVRSLLTEALHPQLDTYESKFVWFGTDLVFDAFTFIFKETEHGLVQAHAYPFDANTSTFIVECNKDVWERAGLGELSEEENIQSCQRLFAEQLQGHRLLSNRSIWTSFVKVTNGSWHEGNVVLLGDAAHTAHFTIGSGTKLAMEDSLALANAFVRYDRVEAALVDYEMERQPVVERFQEAARESARYFENVKHYAGVDPVQFAFNLLTRSGRIGYANMTLRDPRFVRTLDSWVAKHTLGRGNGAVRRIGPPPMFAPLRLGDLTLPNRVVLAPPAEQPAHDGIPGEERATGLARAAMSGAGMVLTEPVAVSAEARITRECSVLESERHAEAWKRVVARVHDESEARIALQLNHAGRRGATHPRTLGVDLPLGEDGWPLLAASPLSYAHGGPVPKQMDGGDMERTKAQFAAAARLAAEAGFDAIELNFAQGYLVASFLSPLTNRRDDAYGGDREARLTYPLEVFDAVREVWPNGRPLAVRISATDWKRGGAGVEDAVVMVAALAEHGGDLFHVVAGQTVPDGRPEYGRSFLTTLSDQIRSQAGVPTVVGGYITTGDEVNTAIGAGRADLCMLDTRVLNEDPAVR
jgi:anthraniloyl-CoA monooxygenase